MGQLGFSQFIPNCFQAIQGIADLKRLQRLSVIITALDKNNASYRVALILSKGRYISLVIQVIHLEVAQQDLFE